MAKKAKPEKAETQTDSPAEEKTPAEETEKTDTKVVKKPESEVEAVWDELAGSTQDRVVQLVRRAKKAETDLETTKAQLASRPAPETEATRPEAPSNEEVREAINKLRDYGVVTKEDLRTLQDRLYLDRESQRLEDKYDGSDSRPKYVPEEVEDFARVNFYGGNLEAAYWDMYRDELIDAEVKSRGSQKKKIVTEKPVASVKIGEKPLTRESLAERLNQSDGAEWWQKNREKIEPLLKKLSQA